MSTPAPHVKILIVEDEDDLREILCFAVESQLGVTALEASSGNQAISIIKANPDIALVLCDMRMRDGDGTVVFRYLQEKRPDIPFFICSADPPELHKEISGPPYVGYLQKPFQMRVLTDQVQKIVGQTPAKPVPSKPRYCRIRASLVLKADLLACNLYVKLSDAKYVKLLSSGEQLTVEDIQRYEQKSVDFLYVPAEECSHLLEKLTRDLRKMGKFLATVPISRAVQDMIVIENSTLEVIHELGQALGITQEVSELTWASVDLALKAIQKTGSLRELFTSRMCEKGSYISAHSVLLAHAACAIAPLVSLDTPENRNALTLAAFLHDLALEDERLARVKVLSELSEMSVATQPVVVARVEQHPQRGVEFVKRVSSAPPEAALLVELHHERADGRGFPKGIEGGGLPPLSVVFNLAQDLVDGLLGSEENDVETPDALVARMVRSYPAGPFRDLAVQVAGAIQPKP